MEWNQNTNSCLQLCFAPLGPSDYCWQLSWHPHPHKHTHTLGIFICLCIFVFPGLWESWTREVDRTDGFQPHLEELEGETDRGVRPRPPTSLPDSPHSSLFADFCCCCLFMLFFSFILTWRMQSFLFQSPFKHPFSTKSLLYFHLFFPICYSHLFSSDIFFLFSLLLTFLPSSLILFHFKFTILLFWFFSSPYLIFSHFLMYLLILFSFLLFC